MKCGCLFFFFVCFFAVYRLNTTWLHWQEGPGAALMLEGWQQLDNVFLGLSIWCQLLPREMLMSAACCVWSFSSWMETDFGILGPVQKSCKLINIFSFVNILIEIFYLRSKLILSTLKLPQFLRMNGHRLVMMTSQIHHIKTCHGNHGAWKKIICGFYIFTRMKLGNSPMKIHQELKSVYGTSSCSYDTVSLWIRRFKSCKKDLRDDEPRSGTPKTAMRTKNLATAVNSQLHVIPLLEYHNALNS